jgi:hypothetical protein
MWGDGPKRRLIPRQTGDKSNYVSGSPRPLRRIQGVPAGRSPGVGRRSAASAKGEGEPVSGNREFWKLEALENGRRTHLTYYIYTDPGGALPRVVEAVQPQALVAE